MTKSELMEFWKGVPGNAEIVVEADHGQSPEFAHCIEITQEDIEELSGDLEEIRWRYVSPSTKLNRVTAILIRG